MTDTRESAIIVAIALPAELERVRLAYLPVGQLGIPAHVTLLYPFLAPDRITAEDITRLRGVMRGEPAFTVELTSVRAFPAGSDSAGTVYLVPIPPDVFLRLTRAIWASFPDCPPYEGAFDVVIPHLTLADDAARLGEIEERVRPALPLRRRVSEAWLIVEGDDGRWTRRARLALGPPSRARAGATR